MKINDIFRKKSLERLSSPESLTEYIRVANPSIWVLLVSIILIFISVFIWSFTSDIATTSTFTVISRDNNTNCYVLESDIGVIAAAKKISINGTKYNLGEIPSMPRMLDASNTDDEYVLHCMGANTNENLWVYELPVEGDFADGVYTGTVIGKILRPITLVTN